jgi:hypothetical protein
VLIGAISSQLETSFAQSVAGRGETAQQIRAVYPGILGLTI